MTGLAHDRASKVAYDPKINEEGLRARSLKLAALQKIAPMLRRVEGEIESSVLRQHVARRLDMEESIVVRAAGKERGVAVGDLDGECEPIRRERLAAIGVGALELLDGALRPYRPVAEQTHRLTLIVCLGIKFTK